jgi:phage terminase large subunit-like protein
MCQMSIQGYQGKGSPDRVDALVWAVHEGLIASARSHAGPPRLRSL